MLRSAESLKLDINAAVGKIPSVIEINGTRNVDGSVFKCGICKGVNRFLQNGDCTSVYNISRKFEYCLSGSPLMVYALITFIERQ